MKTLEQQINSLGCGIYAVKLNSQGRLRDAVVSVSENARTQIRMQVTYQKDGFTWVKTYKVKGDGICECGLVIANEAFQETWDVLIQFPKGQVEVK